MKGATTVPRELRLPVSEWWGGFGARHPVSVAAVGPEARPAVGTGTPGRSWGDLLLAAGIAVVAHGAFFAGSCFFPSAATLVVVPAMPAESPDLAVVSFEADEPAVSLELEDEPLEAVRSETSAPVATTIVRLDLLRPPAGSMAFSAARFGPTLDGAAGGFRLENSALCCVGRGMALPVFELAELDQPPVILAQPLPQYPPSLLRTSASGEVLVCFVVGVDGAVRTARVVQTTQPEFAVPALQAVARWKFRPGRKDGRAVATRVEVPIAFSVPGRG